MMRRQNVKRVRVGPTIQERMRQFLKERRSESRLTRVNQVRVGSIESVFETLANSTVAHVCIEKLNDLRVYAIEEIGISSRVNVLVEVLRRFEENNTIAKCTMSFLTNVAEIDSSCRDGVIHALGGIEHLCAGIRQTGDMNLLRSIGSTEPRLPFHIYGNGMIETIHSRMATSPHVFGVLSNMTARSYGEIGIGLVCREGLIDKLTDDILTDDGTGAAVQLIDNLTLSNDYAHVDSVCRNPCLLGVLDRSVTSPLTRSDIFRICSNVAVGGPVHRKSVYRFFREAMGEISTNNTNTACISEAILFLATIVREEKDPSRLPQVLSILSAAGMPSVPDSVSAEIYCACADYARNASCALSLRKGIVEYGLSAQIEAHCVSSNSLLRLPSQFFSEALHP